MPVRSSGTLRVGFAAAGATLILACLVSTSGSAQQQQPSFRAGVVLVPVDVRALDQTGAPVTDLMAGDFEVLEDGVPQPIVYFVTLEHVTRDAEPALRPSRRDAAAPEALPPAYRTFLLVLGRGRLQGPSKGLHAAIDFVRTGVHSQDYIGVMMYRRVTDVMRARDPILRLLEVHRERHETIEAALQHWFDRSALQFGRGTGQVSRRMQEEIDALFERPGVPRARAIPAPVVLPRPRPDERMVNDLLSHRNSRIPYGPFNMADRQNLEQLFAGIEYLRELAGEKHLIFLSEDGLYFLNPLHRRSQELSDTLARRAADARVTLSIIQTAGLELKWDSANLSGVPWNASRERAMPAKPPQLLGRSQNRTSALVDSRAVAEESGGLSVFYRSAGQAFAEIAAATRFQYVLGYYPSRPRLDGSYRRVQIRVNRPDIRLLYRRGYYAQP